MSRRGFPASRLLPALLARVVDSVELVEASRYRLISAKDLEDKIRGGLLAQIIGILNGLSHETRCVEEPGEVQDYVPSLPQGARTDDETDLEWMYVTMTVQRGTHFSPYPHVAELRKEHVNAGMWCANEYARELIKLGLLPPQTGSSLTP